MFLRFCKRWRVWIYKTLNILVSRKQFQNWKKTHVPTIVNTKKLWIYKKNETWLIEIGFKLGQWDVKKKGERKRKKEKGKDGEKEGRGGSGSGRGQPKLRWRKELIGEGGDGIGHWVHQLWVQPERITKWKKIFVST